LGGRGGAKGLRIHRDHRQPARTASPGRFGHERDAREIAQQLTVALENLALTLHPLFQHLQLAATDGAPLRCATGLPAVAARCSFGSYSRSPAVRNEERGPGPGWPAYGHGR